MKATAASAACAAALAMTASMGSTASAGADDPPPSGQITIEIATVNGSGCRGTFLAPSIDNTAFMVIYGDYMAQAGGTAGPTDFRKNCQLNLGIHVPQGFTYAIAGADYQGFASLESGASGLEKANFYFKGMPQTLPISHTISGPFFDNWQFSDRTPVTELVFKPCGEDRNLNINTELRVNKGTSDPTKTSFMSFDSVDSNMSTIYHFAWKHCPDR